MVDWFVGGPETLDDIMADIEASWPGDEPESDPDEYHLSMDSTSLGSKNTKRTARPSALGVGVPSSTTICDC